MRISVIVCTRNSQDVIVTCLKSVRRQTRPPDEIVVVDGASADRTVELARMMGVDTIVSDGGRGLGYARQLGVESSTGDLVCFVDSDTWIPLKWIEMMLSYLTKGDDLVAVQDFYVSCGINWVAKLESFFFNVSTFRAMMGSVGIATGIENSIWVRDFILKHKFDRRFRILEDLEYLYRVNKLGVKTMRTTNVFHVHFPRVSLRESYGQYWNRGYYTALFHHVHKVPRRSVFHDVVLTPIASLRIGVSAALIENSPIAMAAAVTAIWKRAAFLAGYSSLR